MKIDVQISTKIKSRKMNQVEFERNIAEQQSGGNEGEIRHEKEGNQLISQPKSSSTSEPTHCKRSATNVPTKAHVKGSGIPFAPYLVVGFLTLIWPFFLVGTGYGSRVS
jgi:hypothetical protein